MELKKKRMKKGKVVKMVEGKMEVGMKKKGVSGIEGISEDK